MKVVRPTPLVRQAAAILEPVVDDVVVIGAVAVVIALSPDIADESHQPVRVPIAATRDIDVAVEPDAARQVVARLESAGLVPSREPGERGFTWQRDDLKVQLMSPPAGPRMGGSLALPVQPALGIVRFHQLEISFSEAPDARRLRSATPGALVALKRAAFGRRDHEEQTIERDYHDVFQLIAGVPDDLLYEARAGDYAIRANLDAAAAQGPAARAAAREHLRLRLADNERAAELGVRRVANAFLRRLRA